MNIIVYGLPVSQGSKRHVGHGIMVESSKRLKPWREDIRQAVLERVVRQGEFGFGPLDVHLTFTLPRPKSHYRTGRNAHLLRDSAPVAPAVRPDIDKLARAVLDAIGSAGYWADDSQVVRLTAEKTYPAGRFTSHSRALDRPGVVIDIAEHWAVTS